MHNDHGHKHGHKHGHSHNHNHDHSNGQCSGHGDVKPRKHKVEEMDEEDMVREDRKHFQDIVDAFSYYGYLTPSGSSNPFQTFCNEED